MLEKEIQKTIIEWLEYNNYYVIRVNSGSYKLENGYVKGAPAGTPDLIVCSPSGQFIGIEVKRKGNKPTELQKQTLARINELGGLGVWVTSLDELIEDLEL